MRLHEARSRKSLLAAVVLLIHSAPLWAKPVFAQDAAPLRRTLIVHVSDKQKKSVGGLRAENFRGEIDGKPLKVLSGEPDTRPHRIVLLIDAGLSMRRLGTMEDAWKVADELVQTLGERHAISVWTLSQQLSRHVDFTTDPQALQHALELAQARTSKTDPGLNWLRYPVLQLAQEFPHPEPGDSICIITDNPALWYDRDVYDEVVNGMRDEIVRLGLRLSVIALGSLEPQGRRDYSGVTAIVAAQLEAEWERLRDSAMLVAKATGGGWALLEPGTIERNQTHAVLSPWYEEILQTYRLEVELPEPIAKPRTWKFEVVDAGGKKMRGLRISHPKVCVPLQEGQ